MEHKVLAVVVTHNRLECLKECITALERQRTSDFDILVINNGSTDGTMEYLESMLSLKKIHQDNLGGAGGFYSGMKFMFEHGYEWLWMMDDDGIPDSNQLWKLLEWGEKGNLVLNALVVNKDDHSKLAFRVGDIERLDQIADNEITDKIFHPFNGTFINRKVIEKIGFIKKEMFIWGDEQEYKNRIIANGFQPLTVISAIHYHPQEKGTRLSVLPGLSKSFILDKPRSLSKIYYRNLGYISKTYGKSRNSVFRIVLYHIIAYSWRFRFSEALKFLYYFNKGRQNKF